MCIRDRPAISANIEAMASDAKGYALLEIIDPDDQQNLEFPAGLNVEWIINSRPDREHTLLFDAVKKLPWLEGNPYVWVAGEFTQSLAIRTHMRKERGITREQMYASSYWQIGQTEDGHRISKASVAEH